MTALRGVLSLLAIRTLLCKELGLPLDPFFGERVEVITDVKQMPTTIGKVMEFADTQCKEYAEILTVQRLANFLKDDYEGSRNEEIEGILNKIKPVPNINIGVLNGTATGEARQNFTDSSLAESKDTSLLTSDDNPKLLE